MSEDRWIQQYRFHYARSGRAAYLGLLFGRHWAWENRIFSSAPGTKTA